MPPGAFDFCFKNPGPLRRFLRERRQMKPVFWRYNKLLRDNPLV